MNVNCVYVTYNSDVNLLIESINSIYYQVNSVTVVINSSDNLNLSNYDTVKIVNLNQNVGIATAQNIGIEMARKEGFEFVILSDQDSIYPDNYINNMLSVYNSAQNVAAVFPSFVDKNRRDEDRISFAVEGPICKRLDHSQDNIISVFEGIASGMLLNVDVLDKVGLMNESLFIDWVDFEWSWRARSKGYKLLGAKNIKITHHLGEEATYLYGKAVNERSPLRHYYITRNAFYLSLNSKSLGSMCRFIMFFSSFKYLFGYPLLFRPRLVHLKFVLLGFIHGVSSKLGKLE